MLEKISKAIHKFESLLKFILSKIVSFIFSVLWIVLWLPLSIKYALSPSYFPEEKRKNALMRILENFVWTIRHQRANKFYTLYGLDVSGKSGKEYIDENEFWKGLNKINRYNSAGGGGNHICLLRDKLLFYQFMTENRQPVPNVFAVIKNGKLYDSSMNETDFSVLRERKNYFLKSIDGECASFVKHIHSYKDLLETVSNIDNGMYILQEAIVQSKEMDKLYDGAVNTLRIVTIYNNGNPYVMTSLLRVGTKASGNVDNWAVGGLAIGIKENGCLRKYGFYKPGKGLKAEIHPDSKVRFEDFAVPQYQKALKAACDAHKCFYNIGAIGWDVAITADGPVFVEGNDNFEITLVQSGNGGLKEEWKKACSACTAEQ